MEKQLTQHDPVSSNNIYVDYFFAHIYICIQINLTFFFHLAVCNFLFSPDPREYASFLRHMLNTVADRLDGPIRWKDNANISILKSGGTTSDMQAFLDKQKEMDGNRRRRRLPGEWDRPQMTHTEALDAVNKNMSKVDKVAFDEVMGLLSTDELEEYVQVYMGYTVST